MDIARGTLSAVVIAALAAGYAAPARAEEPPKPKRSAATVVKWTLIGAAAGAGIGLLAGFRAYDDAPYAERKIGKATVGGGGIGAAAGFGIGLWRSQPSAPRTEASRSAWSIERKTRPTPNATWPTTGRAPTLRSLAQPARPMW